MNRPLSHPRKIRLPLIAGLLACSTFALLAAGCQSAATASSGVGQTVSPAQANALINSGAYVLDVREPGEFAKAHISGSALIPLGSLPTRINLVPRDRLVIVVCRTGVRSAQGRDFLLQSGYTQVTSLAGGLEAWILAGYPLDLNTL